MLPSYRIFKLLGLQAESHLIQSGLPILKDSNFIVLLSTCCSVLMFLFALFCYGWTAQISSFLLHRLCFRPHSTISLLEPLAQKLKVFFMGITQCSSPAEVWPVLCRMKRWSCQCCRLIFYFFTSVWCFSFFVVAWCCWLMFSLWSIVTASSFFSELISHLPSSTCAADSPYLTIVNSAHLLWIFYFCWTMPLIYHVPFEFYISLSICFHTCKCDNPRAVMTILYCDGLQVYPVGLYMIHSSTLIKATHNSPGMVCQAILQPWIAVSCCSYVSRLSVIMLCPKNWK